MDGTAAAGCPDGFPSVVRAGRIGAISRHPPTADDLRDRVRLHLSEGTVRNYLSACIQKTGARSRAEALRIAGDRGWL